ncbi:uncharacterized protein TNCV_4094271 [Trichonephila clavipes]|nr:uncharacterized protein TNCV_4094271 [Trichonephila clavipes]
MDWPARSLDLNPIEHVWDFLGRRLAARTLPPVTIRELRLALQDEWAAMPQQLIDPLILSMGRRCETCLAVREIISTKDRMFLAGHPSQGCFGLQSHCAPCYFFNQASFYPSDFSIKSATVDMIGCIHSDLFHQDRLLLNLMDLKIKLIRSKPKFCLQGFEGFRVVLDHVSLFIRKARVNPGVILGHAKALEKTSAKYPINRVLCKVYSIPKGSMSFIQDNIFSGQMPKTFL